MPGKAEPPKPRFFATPAALRRWLLQHHDTATELWVGMYKVSTNKKSVTWKEVVDEVLCAFEARTASRSSVYSFEQERKDVTFPAAYAKRFKANKTAWQFFQSQPVGYQRTATWWVISAKQESTRDRRLDTLIADSESGLRLAHLRPAPTRKTPRS